jgi:hypothetical protein
VKDDERVQRRRNRLREELLDARVRLDLDGPEGVCLVEEIDYARYPPRHERSFPRYGAIVVPRSIPPARVAGALAEGVTFPGDGCSVGDLRRLADGDQSFLLRVGDRADLVLLPARSAGEADVVRLRRRLGPEARIVQRDRQGGLRVLGPTGIVVWDGTSWWNKPYADQYARAVKRSAPSCSTATLTAILDFCVHSVGPAPAGAILVWALDGATCGRIRSRSRLRSPKPLPQLSLQDPLAHGAVRHLLAQVDGATLIDPDARLLETGIYLASSLAAHEFVHLASGRGTRHAAGKRFSYDEERVIVFVISEDGPVTVFSDGSTVASIDLRAAANVDAVAGEESADRSVAVLQCARCDRCFGVARADDPATEATTVPCPVCGAAAQPPWPNADPRTWVLKRPPSAAGQSAQGGRAGQPPRAAPTGRPGSGGRPELVDPHGHAR